MPMPMPMQEESVSEAEDILNDTEESRTLNKVVVFKIPEAEGDSQKVNELIELGSVEIGKIHETITAVRFFDTISYVVTFERTDPFYVLDLSDHSNPKILGELEVPGFSEFMHPIREDNSMLITVGKDADENGFVTGFQISIFDSTIPDDPKLVDRLVIKNTSSSSSWDERSFRYIQVGDVGRLIIPLYSYNWDRVGNYQNSFDGFTVFSIDLNRSEMISREIDINHWIDTGRQCYCSFPARSFVFDGNLMTIKAASVISTNLVSEEIKWTLSLQDKECCY
jgi:DNA excision repair protein ERCC-4